MRQLGLVVLLMALAGLLLLPFVTYKDNRIAAGQALGAMEALTPAAAILLHLLVVAGITASLIRMHEIWRLLAGLAIILALTLMLGQSASFLTPEGNRLARVAPGAGFWVLFLSFALLVTDALARLRFDAWKQLGLLAALSLLAALVLWSGLLDDLSIMKEYAGRRQAFHTEARNHLLLSFGSLAAAAIAGIPLGIACRRRSKLRASVLNVLNVVQTVPSLALFGLMIAPLAFLAANLPGARALGISGIGFAPAMAALFAYSLLPIVANTIAGLDAVPPALRDAAWGMGMKRSQVLRGVELPLALPVILAGIRIVLVQNIGLATIAALIGGGGFGVFVFQGIGQTAMDLVLLGTVPTVALAVAAAIVLDALVALSRTGSARR